MPASAGISISKQMTSGHSRQDSPTESGFPRRAVLFKEGLMAVATSPTLFASAGPAPTPTDVADDHSMLTLDRELDFLLERIEDEIEESGEASKEAMERLQLFCQAMNVKVDRIGRYLAVMKTRAAHCKQESARYATRAKRAENKIARTESMVLYYLESHDLKQLETDDFSFRRQKNSQDSVIARDAQAVPPELNRYELKPSRCCVADRNLGGNFVSAMPHSFRQSIPHQAFGEPSMTTTTLKVGSLPREFMFNGSRIPDPDPRMGVEEVRDLLTPSYPEIATATVTGPEDTGSSLRYTFSRAIGSKG
jgi:PRTRC genetic system protein C